MKASTRLDSSQTAVLHKQRRRRGSPEMNKRKVSASLCHEGGSCSKRADATADLSGAIEAGNKEDSEKYSKRTVMVQLHSTPFFSDGRSWESQFGDFFFELVFVSSHLSCGHWRGRGRGSGIDNGAGGCSYSRSVTTLKGMSDAIHIQ
ncbi:hypothetical protein YC2023_101937 [Brassica napus]